MDASAGVVEDKYRYLLRGDIEKDTKWKYGVPPNYDVVNKLFEQGRTKIWPAGSLEEKVQNLIKTWEMEIFHKTRIQDMKSLVPDKFTLSVNGRKALDLEGIAKIGGGYNPLLQTSLPEELSCYNPADYDADASHKAFITAFPRGFALEILQVYSGPPTVMYKFRHWGYMEGPFKGHAPTGDLVELFGVGVLEVDEEMRVVKVEFFYDRGELLGGLIKGAKMDPSVEEAASSCPVLSNTG